MNSTLPYTKMTSCKAENQPKILCTMKFIRLQISYFSYLHPSMTTAHKKLYGHICSIYCFMIFQRKLQFSFLSHKPILLHTTCMQKLYHSTSHKESNKPLTIFFWFTNYLLWFNKGKHSFLFKSKLYIKVSGNQHSTFLDHRSSHKKHYKIYFTIFGALELQI